MKVFIRAVRKAAEASTGHWQLRNRECPDFVLDDRTRIRGVNVKPGFEVEPDLPVHRSQVWERINPKSRPPGVE
jgi:hypothetical protein